MIPLSADIREFTRPSLVFKDASFDKGWTETSLPESRHVTCADWANLLHDSSDSQVTMKWHDIRKNVTWAHENVSCWYNQGRCPNPLKSGRGVLSESSHQLHSGWWTYVIGVLPISSTVLHNSGYSDVRRPPQCWSENASSYFQIEEVSLCAVFLLSTWGLYASYIQYKGGH